MTLYRWSQTASSDATADSTINWAEGQAPSSVNDSGRAMMAATAKYRDDIAGAIVTSGTSTAYTVSSYQVFDTLAHLSGQMIAFTPHTTNGAGPVTLNVDSLGAKPLRVAPGVELQAGTVIQGTPYVVTYNNSDGAFYLQGFYGNPYNVPLGAGMDYWGSTAPNPSFAIPTGQAISRTTYTTLFALIGTQYGAGNGSTTFNLPDKSGRVSAMYEPSGSVRLTSTYFGGGSTVLGSVGGAQEQALAANQIPSLTSNGSNAISVNSTINNSAYGNITTIGAGSGAVLRCFDNSGGDGILTSSGTNAINVAYTNNSQANVTTIQPTIICNYILRII